jgi:hypothetical protein
METQELPPTPTPPSEPEGNAPSLTRAHYAMAAAAAFVAVLVSNHTSSASREGRLVRWIGHPTNAQFVLEADVDAFNTNGGFEMGLCADGTVVWRNRAQNGLAPQKPAEQPLPAAKAEPQQPSPAAPTPAQPTQK